MSSYKDNEMWLKKLLDLLEAHFGTNVEFVLHDLTLDYEHTIVDIRNGEVTGRTIGDTGDMLGLKVIRNLDDHQDVFADNIDYTPDGKVVRSSSLFLRDENGKPVICLGINEDITADVEYEKQLHSRNRLTTSSLQSNNYRGNVNDMLQHLLDEAQQLIGKNPSLMSKEDKMQYIEYLDKHGAFLITYSNTKVCEALNISQFSLYNYLRILRSEKSNISDAPCD